MRKFNNKFGSLTLELVTRDKLISTISSKDVPENCFIDIDTAEQIALITGNHHVQLSFEYLENPRGVVPGTKMTYPGLKDAQARVNVITYLNEADGSPEPLQ